VVQEDLSKEQERRLVQDGPESLLAEDFHRLMADGGAAPVLESWELGHAVAEFVVLNIQQEIGWQGAQA
jgi:hypothetical protein